MTVISLVQSNIVRFRSSVHREVVFQKNKARRLLAIILIFSVILVSICYILQVNTIATKGYKIRGLKKQIDGLKDKNKTLQIEISNLKSIEVLQSKSVSSKMMKAEDIEYVTLPPASVVLK